MHVLMEKAGFFGQAHLVDESYEVQNMTVAQRQCAKPILLSEARYGDSKECDNTDANLLAHDERPDLGEPARDEPANQS